MNTIRRWYILGVSAVSVQCVTWAIIALLRNLLLPDQEAVNQSLIAFQLAVIIIGTPLFFVHWLWAQRLARADEAEQRAATRWVYLYGLLVAFLLPLLIQALQLGTAVLQHLFEIAEYDSWDPYQSLAGAMVYHIVAFLVLAMFAGYHQQVIRHDGQPSAGQALVRRVYLYGFSLIALWVTAVTTFGLLQWLLYQIGTTDWRGTDNLAIPAETIPGVIIWAIAWVMMWRQAQQCFASDDEAERESALRKLYLYVVIFSGIATAVASATFILAGFFRSLLDLPSQGTLRDPLTGIIIGTLLWGYHAYILHKDEAIIQEQPQQASVRRLYYYLIAGVGLGVFLLGFGGIISVGIRAIGGEAFANDLREQLAWSAAAFIAGLPVWFTPWWQIEQAIRLPDEIGDAEQRSQVRKVYLYVYLFAATMAALSGAVYTVSQVIELILGSRTVDGLVSDVGQAIAFMLIAVAVWVYHGRILRSDNRQMEHIELMQLQSLRVAVVGDPAFAEAVQSGLQAIFPALLLTTAVNEADVVVGDWQGIQATVVGRKLIIPTAVAGMDWVGTTPVSVSTAVNLTADALKQITRGEPIQSTSLGFGQILGYVVLGMIGFGITVPLIIFLIEQMM